MLSAGLLVGLLCLMPGVAFANPASPADPASNNDQDVAVFEQLGAREQILDMQREVAAARARRLGLLAYRMARHRELGFAAAPENRRDEASAFDLALVALRRSADETQALARELNQVRTDRTTMESALIARALAASKQSEADDRVANRRVQLMRPVKGTPVAVPGVRRDGPTKVELHHDSVDLLARLDDPVHAVAAGVVKRVELLPQGGFAVVTAHPGGLTSIVSGLREVRVRVDDAVAVGQTLGLAGRNLDGAVVISLEIWRDRRAQDAAKLLRARVGT